MRRTKLKGEETKIKSCVVTSLSIWWLLNTGRKFETDESNGT